MFDENYKYDGMTITGAAYNNRVEVEVSAESDIFEFLSACRTVAIGLTYHENSWKRAIIELAQEYEEELAESEAV
jgi:hypothetical protein